MFTARSRRPARVALSAVAAAAALVLAACGSSSNGSTSSSAPAPSDSGSTSSSPSADGLAAAQAHVDQATQRPTAITITTPVSKPVPTGKSIIFISCGTPTCAQESDIIKSATDKLQWTLETINTDGSPEQNKSAWDTAVRKKPTAILYTATDRTIIDSQLKAAAAADIFVSACCLVDPIADGINYIIGDATTNAVVGQDLAALAAVNNAGSGSTLYVDLPVFPILGAVKNAYNTALAEFSPEVKSEVLDLTLASIGKDAPDKIVSAVRANPDIKTVVLSVDAIGIGLPAALKAAGLSEKVYVIGEGPVPSTLTEIQEGLRGPSNVFPYYESMYSMVDAVVRHVVGDPIDPLPGLPSNWVVTKENMPADISTGIFWLVEDGQEQFYKVWGLS